MGISFPTTTELSTKKLRVALVGIGSRGTSTWGKDLVNSHGDYIEMEGLCDSNYR